MSTTYSRPLFATAFAAALLVPLTACGGSDGAPSSLASNTATVPAAVDLQAIRGDNVDLHFSWNGATDAHYEIKSTDGGSWSTNGVAEGGSVTLSDIPQDGEYSFCITEDGEQSCTSFSTHIDNNGNLAAPTVTDGTKTPAETETAGSDGPPVNECDNPQPEWIWCDDFEEDRMSAYFEASMPRRDGAGIDGSTGIVGQYLLGTAEAGNLKLAFGRTPGGSFRPVDEGTQNYREIYWRVYLKHPEDWQAAAPIS
ncbi:hypothetical protein CAI21_10465 [Alkalilimnicola ehrlichii]|uniref:hypothetical protein n=1 Tax=Alkalilimnicola ehrlichii TaxID=351052 RepID=UPI000E2EA058|nr:hypothetical protein [Alkalilimnicola ehrlichii]RFA29183.1 hypothetical protein CAI21_10465 [Alkalilimnicola ehrlichii]